MSEQNILNPTVGHALNPDYAWSAGLPQMNSKFQAKSGKVYNRQLLARGRVYDLAWTNRTKTELDQLRQWEAQYRNDFFTFFDQERQRYFSGQFAAPLQESPAKNNQWNAQAQFVEIPGLPMFSYPNTNWNGAAVQDSIFLEEKDGFGNLIVKLTGSGWTAEPGPGHGGGDYFTNSTGDYAEWLYYGYGCRVWSRKQANIGIVAISLDGGAETNVDLYSASGLSSAPVLEIDNVSLGLHRIRLRCTGTKNASATGFNIYADAIEVMQ